MDTTCWLLSCGRGNFQPKVPTFHTKILCVYGSFCTPHRSLTVPMPHYEYNEWWDKVEIGIHCPQWSPLADFWVAGGKIFSPRSPLFTPRYCVCMDLFALPTGAWLFQCLIMSIMNGGTRLRLEFIVHNGHHLLTFELREGKFSAQGPHFSHQDIVCVWIFLHSPQELDCSNASLWV